MLEKIAQLFPGAEIREKPIYDTNSLLFFAPDENQYISIPKQYMTEREVQLLEAILEPVEQTASFLNPYPIQEKWYAFLFAGGTLPIQTDKRIRFIHFTIDFRIDRNDFLQAIHPLFHEGMTTVWIDETNGFFIESESPDKLTYADFHSFIEALLSDFYYSISFYIGRFYHVDDSLKRHFQREQLYFQQVRTHIPEEHIFTFETAFPIALVLLEKKQIIELLYDEWTEVFHNDLQLLKMIKLFLENNSNVSLTAKELFLHRNSLQYRIDKFMEHTSIDIKSFPGALSVYFICIFGQYLSRNGFLQTDEKFD